jgi:hypothetical protein
MSWRACKKGVTGDYAYYPTPPDLDPNAANDFLRLSLESHWCPDADSVSAKLYCRRSSPEVSPESGPTPLPSGNGWV